MGISVDITYKPLGDQTYLNYEEMGFEPTTNNVNKLSLSTVNITKKPFLLGNSAFGDNSVLMSSYPGIIDSDQSSYNGSCDYNIYIINSNIKNIKIYFDTAVGEYATSIQLITNTLDITVANTNPSVFEYNFDDYVDSLRIQILKWSAVGKNVIINAIIAGFSEQRTYTERDIKNLVCSQEISGDNTLPSFGLIGQYGSFKIMDRKNELLDFMNKNMLRDNSEITIKYNGNLIGTFYSKSWTYEEKSKSFSVQLEDKTKDLNNILVPRLGYVSMMSALDLIYILLGYSNYKDLVETAELFGIWIQDFYMEECSLYEAFNKFCQLTQTCLFVNQDGLLEVVDYV